MSPEEPVTAGRNEEPPPSAATPDPATVAMLQQSFRDAPLQTFRWEDYMDDQHQTQHDRPRRTVSLRAWLHRNLLGVLEREKHQPDISMEGPKRYQEVIDESLAQAVKNTRESFCERPPDDTLSPDEVVILLGDFFAERLAYRGKLLPGDPVSITGVRSRNFTLPGTPMHRPQVIEIAYQYCLSNQPESHKYETPIPPATADMLRHFTSSWPSSLREADLLHEICCAPSIAHWRWLQEGQNIESKDATSFTMIPQGPNNMRLARTMGHVKTEKKLTGSICFVILNVLADTLSLGELVQTANHLLGELLYVGDPIDERERFGRLDKFYLPLICQLSPTRDNLAWGPWSSCDGPFSSIFHHLRCLGGEPSCMGSLSGNNGFTLNRVCRRFSTKVSIVVGERRISIAVLARYDYSGTAQPVLRRYNGLFLVSPGSECLEDWTNPPHELVRSIGLEPVDGTFAPVFCFLALYAVALDVWSLHWWSFVEGVERLLEDDDILAHNDLHGLSKGSTDVEGYFDIIRLLRTAICWIESTGSEFDLVESSIMKTDQSGLENYDVMKKNFDIVRGVLRGKTEGLTTKIGRMLHDVKSLRQDLQSAASLREISGANRVNEHLRFLAILTTVYLPLNLLAAVCGNSISIAFDQTKQAINFVLCGIVLAAITWAFPLVHSRMIDHKRNACNECLDKPRTHGPGLCKHEKSKLQAMYESANKRFSRLKSLRTASSRTNMRKRARKSKEASSEDRSTVEPV